MDSSDDNFDEVEKSFYDLGERIGKLMPEWVSDGLDLIGLMAQGNMLEVDKTGVNPADFSEYILGAPSNPTKLTSRSGRLARSLAPGGGSFNPAGNREGIHKVRVEGDRVIGKKGSRVPYANIHQKGGTITQTVTDKQRAFFWAMALQMNSDMFRAMALSTTLTIHIPARPIMPTQEEARKRIMTLLKQRVEGLIRGRL